MLIPGDKFDKTHKKVSSNGKGDTPRPVDKKKYDENYDRIFGKKKVKDG